ncbi:hypothetical protein TBLA_0E04160 [Henningerozyma blattae CBS 6284]|uniref:Rad4 beta-hairpin domain-containing protein n=1 Tax=Henningerozyma blattae (strain ATCC 34711 / CBS 6284 / DSM 70876 / NBRC 10599 / NRRL Y-10934 / UCD 77-7) TaxID=1071380 RepID=I2H519_HENB6|nr:hypothetical protein TBLA_0E04160 [Tetrapisispora blattae CBS 6284]CCH61471.1 hypothetical protein TBLA_0E04160 [Tetrapisispora blattae CBS 6284]
MSDNLKPEYFQLLRKVLHEKELENKKRQIERRKKLQEEQSQNNNKRDVEEIIIPDDLDVKPYVTKKKLKKYGSKYDNESIVEDPKMVINIDDDDNDDGNISDFDEDEDFNSDEFEDVDVSNNLTDLDGSISITIDGSTSNKTKTASTRKNVCSNEVRSFRKYYHCIYLISQIYSGTIYNEYLNSTSLLKKLSLLVPDKTFDLLTPELDKEMPLRSTRKLLNGLKDCIKIWNKNWRLTSSNTNSYFLMKTWEELQECDKNIPTSINRFNIKKAISKRKGDIHQSAMGFIAMLRSCNLNARLIVSFQPPDFTNLKIIEKRKINNISTFEYKYPFVWCEVWDKFSKNWITIDPIINKKIEQIQNFSLLEPKGLDSVDRNLIRYVIAFDRKNGVKDVTRRYTHWYNSKILKKRITRTPKGEIWYNKIISRFNRRKRIKIDDYEDLYMKKRDLNEPMPDNLSDLKNHPFYVLENGLTKYQTLKKGVVECGFLNISKSSTASKKIGKKILKVYKRSDILELKSPKRWYMEGRVLKTGAKPLKTIIRKNPYSLDNNDESEEERLYSFNETELYIPPIINPTTLEIPKNHYGNIEIFQPTMIPNDCVLIESPIAIKSARFLDIPFAPAVTSFKFEKSKAGRRSNTRSTKANLSGVVVSNKFKNALLTTIDCMEYDIENSRKIEETLSCLQNWNTLFLKLNIKNKLNYTYGTVQENSSKDNESNIQTFNTDMDEIESEDEDKDFASGGFLPRLSRNEGEAPNDNNNQLLQLQSSDEMPESMGGFLPQSNIDIDTNMEQSVSDFDGGFLPIILDNNEVKNTINNEEVINSSNSHNAWIIPNNIEVGDISEPVEPYEPISKRKTRLSSRMVKNKITDRKNDSDSEHQEKFLVREQDIENNTIDDSDSYTQYHVPANNINRQIKPQKLSEPISRRITRRHKNKINYYENVSVNDEIEDNPDMDDEYADFMNELNE